MSDSAAGKPDAEVAALRKEVEWLKGQMAGVLRWRPGIEKGVETAVAEGRAASREVAALRARLDAPRVPEAGVKPPDGPLPWRVDNPNGTPLSVADSFREGLRTIERDGSLRAAFLGKLSAILRAPDSYGKPLSGPRRGQRSARVARNYRVVWTPIGGGVRLELLCSKEDTDYSPFGAR